VTSSGAGKPKCKCGASWSGTGLSHCGACHLTFTNLAAFDRHRKPKLDGGCYYPGKINMVQNEAGHWRLGK